MNVVSSLMNKFPHPYCFDKTNPITFKRWRDTMKDRILASKYLRPYYEWLENEFKEHPEQFAREEEREES